MSINVANDEVKFSVKLNVIFSYLLRMDIHLNFEFFGINGENNVVHPRDQLFMNQSSKPFYHSNYGSAEHSADVKDTDKKRKQFQR